MHDVDVIIVGAGLSGLSAAWSLRNQGLRIAVLEARDRVGGRTYFRGADTDERDVGGFDLGGEFIATSQQALIDICTNVLGYDMSFPIGAPPTATSRILPTDVRGDAVVHLAGQRFVGDANQLVPPGLGVLDKVSLWLLLKRIDSMRGDLLRFVENPWEAPSAADRDGTSVADFLERSWTCTKKVRDLVAVGIRSIWSVEPEEMSLLYFLWYVAAAGSFESLFDNRPVAGAAQGFRFRGGAQQVAIDLAAKIGPDVHLNTAVRLIAQTAEHVHATTDDGTVYRGRALVVATSPLLSAQIGYDPPLPPQRADLAARCPMGRTIKCIATYPKRLWAPHYTGIYVGDLSPICWSMDNTADDGTPALMGFVVGREADALRGLPRDERRKRVTRAFATIFELPELGTPTAYVDLDWTAEPWSMGGPTGVFGPGTLSAYGRALRRPFGRIEWAGTETATQWMGYMSGAVEAGLASAQRVMAKLAAD